MSKYLIYSDGGARGNPGPAGYGFIIRCQDQRAKIKMVGGSGFLGVATNNQAEYQGVLAALKEIVKLLNGQTAGNPAEIHVFLDSKLIVEQMNGRYKIKNEGLKPLFWEIRDLIMQLGGRVTFSYIPREQNCEADRLVNLAIDKGTNNV